MPELVHLLETFGSFDDPAGVADYFGVSHLSLSSFLKTKQAKAAIARYIPGSKEILRKKLRAYDPPAPLDPALPDNEQDLSEMGLTIHEAYSGGPIQRSKRSSARDKLRRRK